MWSPNGKVWSPKMKNVESKILQKLPKSRCIDDDWWKNHLIILYFQPSISFYPGHVIQDTNHDAVLHTNCTVHTH